MNTDAKMVYAVGAAWFSLISLTSHTPAEGHWVRISFFLRTLQTRSKAPGVPSVALLISPVLRKLKGLFLPLIVAVKP